MTHHPGPWLILTVEQREENSASHSLEVVRSLELARLSPVGLMASPVPSPVPGSVPFMSPLVLPSLAQSLTFTFFSVLQNLLALDLGWKTETFYFFLKSPILICSLFFCSVVLDSCLSTGKGFW